MIMGWFIITNKNSRSSLNPFTGKSHFDIVNDDKFLKNCANEYYKMINQSTLLDDTNDGQLVRRVASRLIGAVEQYLMRINRYDYIENYYEWDFHLLYDDNVNAMCMPGGKIVVLSGILQFANTEDRLAFILGHEMAHALLDHSRTKMSQQSLKTGLTTAAWIGGLALDLLGNHEAGYAVRAASNLADIGSELFLIKPFGRQHEIEADKLGMMIIHLAGYDIYQIPNFWEEMSNFNSNNFDFFATHPTDSKRIQAMHEVIYDLENGKDFYRAPLLSEDKTFEDTQIEDTSSTRNYGISSGAYAPTALAPETTNSTTTNYCDKCGAKVGTNDSFCSLCGNNLKENRCPSCGKLFDNGDSFCTNCGCRL